MQTYHLLEKSSDITRAVIGRKSVLYTNTRIVYIVSCSQSFYSFVFKEVGGGGEGGTHSTTSRVSTYTSIVLQPPSPRFTTEQDTAKAYLFVHYYDYQIIIELSDLITGALYSE